MNLIFFGSDQYSAIVLSALLESKICHLSSIITTRPKPVGKSKVVTANPVEKLANKHDLKVSYYPNNSSEMNKFIATLKSSILNLKSAQPLVGLSASFPHLLPPELIDLFTGRLYNLHPSLLPQYRNVAPVPYAIALGDQVTGITLFRIGTGIDNGEIVAQATEPIQPSDTTPILLNRLFEKGTELFINWSAGKLPRHSEVPPRRDEGWVFTRRLTHESGFLEWPVLQKLIANKPISAGDTTNPLIKLRLTHHPDRTTDILTDLVRALEGYEKVWSLVPTKKGELRISLVPPHDIQSSLFSVLISGKPKPITWSDFTQYYL